MSKPIHEYTLEELRAMDNFGYDNPNLKFTSFVIVPMEELHDSGFPRIKVIATDCNDIVGVFSGFADVVHLIRRSDEPFHNTMTNFDILPKSRCVHVFAYDGCFELFSPVCNAMSDLMIYATE